MEEIRDQKPKNFMDINDNQERIFSQLNSIRDRKLINSQKIMRELHKLRLMQGILYLLIIFGITTIFIFILQSVNLLIITINIIIVTIYLISLKFIYAFRKPLKITIKHSKHFIKLEKKKKELSWLQIFIYSVSIIIITLFLFILIIGIDPIILIIVLIIFLLFLYFEKDF